MRILGIIAEYDPFHRGHARHIRLAKDIVRPDFTFIALSGCLKQRGETALLSPYDRALCALREGADAVFALPAEWTVRDAEHYALGGVTLLKGLGATHLAFGAETPDPERLPELARRLENPTEMLRKALKEALAAGNGYPRALAEALAAEDPEAGRILGRPNNILGICYLRAIQSAGGGMTPVVIPRTGDYRESRIDPEAPSASALREALLAGNYGAAFAAVPPGSREVIRRAFLRGRICREETLDALLIRRLRSMTREEAAALPDLSEGLEGRILDAARRCGTRKELLDAVTTRRYPRARISRICAAALLGLTRRDTEDAPPPSRAVLLGLRKNPEMTALWRDAEIPVSSRWENPADLRAWSLWAQCAGLPDTLPWTEKAAVL